MQRKAWGGIFEALSDVAERVGFDKWEMACLDFGGVYVGMVDDSIAGFPKVVGPIMGRTNESLVDPGHNRTRFYNFQWPKE